MGNELPVFRAKSIMQNYPGVKVENVRMVDDLSLEEYISRGMVLRENKDKIQWELGDLADEVSTKLGGGYLAEFAKAIGIQKATLRRYRDVSRAYDEDIRTQFSMLPWSVFRQLAAQPNRIDLLKHAHDNNYSAEKMAAMLSPNAVDDGKDVPPRPELTLCPNCRRWYIPEGEASCPSEGQCMEVK